MHHNKGFLMTALNKLIFLMYSNPRLIIDNENEYLSMRIDIKIGTS